MNNLFFWLTMHLQFCLEHGIGCKSEMLWIKVAFKAAWASKQYPNISLNISSTLPTQFLHKFLIQEFYFVSIRIMGNHFLALNILGTGVATGKR